MSEIDNTPPIKFERDDNGLLKNIQYRFSPVDGKIDWRAMLRDRPEFLVPKKEFEGIPINELKDNQILILLSGIRYLYQLRQGLSYSYPIIISQEGKVTATCSITWAGNFETHGKEITSEGVADASYETTDSLTKYYLAAIAENRAFSRCVRNFLNINILSKEEIPDKKPEFQETQFSNGAPGPHSMLIDLCNKKKVTFEMVQKKMIKMGIEGAAEMKEFKDIPKAKVLELIEIVNNHVSKNA